MKQIMILVMVMAFGAVYSQTTVEEYNYVTKGYKIQVESGLDMKKGYRLVDLCESSAEGGSALLNRKATMTFKGLYKELDKSPCAVMVIYHETGFLDKMYLCIPHWNSKKEIWDLYAGQLEGMSESVAKSLVWGLSKSASFFAQNN
ncbi:hypothetical protein [Haliscomenobacter hydrossis]|uniref:Uncharacterized protein n=1 Tax=Haliscomenobacter hydrossis (strain ATCC 27775 / DSM 1100 / LMG 10767 / O) TaxID=760192 RepID=F4L090_HALH1|nr:hypothetical protein [Haliscomenobacter hydrossis]AEE53763.1 hypothetical protein Halhy_5940 [Haliscomenobacter hydrossis DSM 1100]